MNRYWRARLGRAAVLLAVALLTTAAAYFATPPPDVRHRLSMATAYSALFFLSASLFLGPWNVLRRRHSPISYDLRRDIGITAGLLALIHTGVGLTVHLRGRMWMYFLKTLHPLQLQKNAFGAANFIGLAAALLFLLLLAISNDRSLRSLGTTRWKSLQRWTYGAFAFTVAHGILFQTVEKRHLPWVLLFAGITAVALVAQALGYRAMRQHS